jgi:hypothetical protein
MVSKILDNSIRNVDYLTFLKHYSSELKFMSPWTQVDNAEQSKSSKNNENFEQKRESKDNIKNSSFILSK